MLGNEADIFLEWGRKPNYSPYGDWLSNNCWSHGSKGKLAEQFLWAVCTALTLLTYAIHVASGEQMGQGWEQRGNRGWDLMAVLVSLSSEWLRVTWYVKITSRGLYSEDFSAFFYQATASFWLPLRILFIKGIRVLDERDSLVVGRLWPIPMTLVHCQ